MSTFGIGNASAKQIGYFSRVPTTSIPTDQKILCELHAAPFLPLQPAFDLDGPLNCPYCDWEVTMDYQKHAARFLLDAGLTFRAVLVGNDCPTFCEDSQKDVDMDKLDTYPRKSHIHGKHYRCTISQKDRGHVSFDFWNSYADEENNYARKHPFSWPKHRKVALRQVTPYDLLACIEKYDPGTFENFCSDFGYDEDSRRAETIYHAVQKEYQKVQRFFTAAELAVLQEIQ
jgi:hypothetical protein